MPCISLSVALISCTVSETKTSDSARTMVTTATRQALVVVFAPHEIDARRLASVLDVTARRMLEFTAARETARSVG